jgi:4-aminobutyrate aminotransferase-like enzyme/Ser/Thr protein kinase RdoA (MazF antagonist)/murein DD-endopeptidase MepM/ murein hydrolase activator NlpD
MNYQELQINLNQAEKILFDLFQIKGKASTLPGELDFNFRIKIPNEDGYILKISRPNEDVNYLNFQQNILEYISQNISNLITPKTYKDKNTIATFIDDYGKERKVRLLSWIEGRVWTNVNPQLNELRYSLGKKCGLLTNALQGFNDTKAHRKFEWDVAQSLWTKKHLDLFSKDERKIITYFQDLFQKNESTYNQLRKAVVHNDANDNNVIVSSDMINPQVISLIDFGDAIHTQIINDLAITCAYAIMHKNDPLEAALPIVKGYHENFNFEEQELNHLYTAIAMRLIISVTKSAINKIKEPDNFYLLISEKPAWELLKKWYAIDGNFATYSFREACGFTAHPKENQFITWAKKQTINLKNLFPTINYTEILPLDLSVSSSWIGHQDDFDNLDLFQFKIKQLQQQNPNKCIAGGYLEPRSIYTSKAYDKIGNQGKESRSIHLGIDFWLPQQTPVHALFDGKIEISINDAGNKKYGGLIIVKHCEENINFYTLYGHLSIGSISNKIKGQEIKKGDCIGYIGNYSDNGNWSPHLHFQVMLSILNYTNDFPGVAYYNQQKVWESICPNPNLWFKFNSLNKNNYITNNELIKYRKQHLGKSLSLQYNAPIKMVRGSGQYLLDQYGTKYLDTVNNVAHVGHEHPAVVKAGQNQIALLNTNSRYLHENINELAQELLKTLPKELSVLHFVNSGSEANELAIRMVKATTGQKDIIASEVGYHGNSNMCIDISSYKFDSKEGSGAPKHTHIFPLPDSYRGKFQGSDCGIDYAKEVQKCIDSIHAKKRGVGALIVEPIISCGGQIELPDNFLPKAYEMIRKAGGLCISDEVQVGCGRLGKTFWGFELYQVIPDIITIGKPLGNGHPLAAVACTQEVAEKFANGMEYFNTFGGNPVSCAIGTEVLRIIKRENLQENALQVGEFLKDELHKMTKKYPIIGDVRGQGLFLGFELVDSTKKPLKKHANYLVNRMKNYNILMSTDGVDNNVLKIKPPIVFTKKNAQELIFYMDKIFQENFMNSY